MLNLYITPTIKDPKGSRIMNNDLERIHQIIDEVEKVIKGKRDKVSLAVASFLAGGHLLIEDLPGVGKTTLAKTLAHVLGLDYSRVQFTSDLLPADILGVNYFDVKRSEFTFKRGPVFSSFLLADEINRATPKTQSALLEAMEEHQVSIDGVTMALPEPFFVIATKNPFEEVGTFELPDSQLDRFLLSFSLGYPERAAEGEILSFKKNLSLQRRMTFKFEEIMQLQERCRSVHLSDVLLDYLQDILLFTRESGLFRHGLSTRGALALMSLSKAWALIEGRDYVIPSDVTHMLPFVIGHRLKAKEGKMNTKKMSDAILKNVSADT